MVIGAPTAQFQTIEKYWQIYEVTGFGIGQTAVITKIANQPANYNNITPIYSPDGRIIYTWTVPAAASAITTRSTTNTSRPPSSRPLEPQPRDRRPAHPESRPLRRLHPSIDSAGRLVFTRWDHLQRDQQADNAGNPYGNFDWADESQNAPKSTPVEIFPSRGPTTSPAASTATASTSFQPWMIHPSGEEEETLNHIGRHELQNYFNGSLMNDPNVDEFIAETSGRFNPSSIENFLQMAEDPQHLGTFFGTDAPEFTTHAAGRIAKIELALERPWPTPSGSPTSPIPAPASGPKTATPRRPTTAATTAALRPLSSNGLVLASHTAEARIEANEGTRAGPTPRHGFRLRSCRRAAAASLTAGASLIAGRHAGRDGIG